MKVGIVGGGAFGTAMACVVRRSGHRVTLWAREPEVAAAVDREALNPLFLPGIALVPGIRATHEMEEAVAGADFLLLAPPAQHMRAVTLALAPFLEAGTPAVSCSKGIERGTLCLMPEVLAQTLPRAPAAVLSGPSFAREIAADLPCAVALAARDLGLARRLAAEISNPRFCVHPCADPAGAALGGVMKNVIGIASGIAAGRKLGENARATLVTLGLEETLRLGLALDARRDTFDGLAGIGDMMLTANSLQSRNTSLGVALGEGRTLAEALAGRREVFEGVHSVGAVAELGKRHGVALPIAQALDRLLNRGAALDTVLLEFFHAVRARPGPGNDQL